MSKELTCPFCLWPLKAEEPTQACPHCDSTYHEECWAENRGCGTFGCPGWTAVQTGQPPPPPPIRVPSAPSGSGPVQVVDLPPVTAGTAQFCDQCGEPAEAGDRFCGICGNTL